MRSGFLISPVFLYEAIAGSRRWHGYLLRSLLVVSMLFALAVAWLSVESMVQRGYELGTAARQMAELGQYFYYGVAGVQLTLALLAAPAATAGAICVDRARGWLEHMFVTHLSDTEIVLGKFTARFATILAFVLAGLPVLAISSLLGGIIPEAIVVLTVVTLAVCLLGCSLAMMLSVRLTRPHEVFLVVLVIWVGWLLSVPFYYGLSSALGIPPPPAWFVKSNPYVLIYAPYLSPGTFLASDVSVFAAIAVLLSVGFVTASVLILRKEPGRRPDGPGLMSSVRTYLHRHLFSWWPIPSLDANPVLWREWHRNRPSRVARAITWLFVVSTIVGMAIGLWQATRNGVGQGDSLEATSGLAILFGLLLLSVGAPTVLTEERVRGSLDLLMTTPLPTRQIVLGKWWACYRRMLPLMILPLVTGVFSAGAATGVPSWLPLGALKSMAPLTTAQRIMAAVLPSLFLLAHGALLTSIGLAAATWLKRTGLAVAVSVSTFVLLTFGWIFTVELILRRLLNAYAGPGQSLDFADVNAVERWLSALSPIGGQSTSYQTLHYDWQDRRGLILAGLFVVVVVVAVFAATLLGFTILTFNHCMGRNDGLRRPRRREAVPESADHAPVASMA